MDIEILGSGSKGNCYKISDGKTTLILDAGLSIKKIKEKLAFKLSDIDGVLISHEHLDHAKAVKDISKFGLSVYMSDGTKEALQCEDLPNIWILKNLVEVKIGSFTVLPFHLKHDAKEPIGFLIKSNYNGKTLAYITDTQVCPYNFNNLNYLMIEINYCDESMRKAVADGTTNIQLAKRIMRNHMSLKSGLLVVKRHTSKQLKAIYLLHLSDTNSDELQIKKEVQRVSGVPVYVC